jgi:hypothetical protein
MLEGALSLAENTLTASMICWLLDHFKPHSNKAGK